MSFLNTFLTLVNPRSWQGGGMPPMQPMQPAQRQMKKTPQPFGNFGGQLQNQPGAPPGGLGYNLAQATGIPALGVLDDGGEVPQSGLYKLQAGEEVYPRRMAPLAVSKIGAPPAGPATQFAPRAALSPRIANSATMAPMATQPLATRPFDSLEAMAVVGDTRPGSRPIPPGANSIDVSNGSRPRTLLPPIPYANAGRFAPEMPAPAPRPDANARGTVAPPSELMAPVSASPVGSYRGELAAAPARPMPNSEKLAADISAGPGMPPALSRGQKVLRGLEAAGVGLLNRNDPVGAAQRFYNQPKADAQQQYQQTIAQDTAAANLERQQAGDAEAAEDRTGRLETEDIGRQTALTNLERGQRELNAPAPPPTLDRVTIEDPRAPGKPLEVRYNAQSGQYIDGSGQPLEGAIRPYEKPAGERITSPFEAYAYGTPAERQAAQDFLNLEKKIDAKYKTPSEVDERYSLYKRDPDAYRQMFGDRGNSQDQVQASRMLQYFDRQKKQVQDDWTLDEPTRAQRLQEIDDLEQPYLNAAAPQPSAGGGGQGGDRVTVVDPTGRAGTIPRSQLKAAQKKGFKLASQ